MKKILSLSLVGLMMFSMIPTAFAIDSVDYSVGTAVSYTGAGTEAYTVTVPAQLAPGQTVTDGVSAEGTLPSGTKLYVTAADSVTLAYNGVQKTLAVTGGDLTIVGSDTEAVSASADISVEGWADEDQNNVAAPLFGEWSGTITYTAEIDSSRTPPVV